MLNTLTTQVYMGNFLFIWNNIGSIAQRCKLQEAVKEEGLKQLIVPLMNRYIANNPQKVAVPPNTTIVSSSMSGGFDLEHSAETLDIILHICFMYWVRVLIFKLWQPALLWTNQRVCIRGCVLQAFNETKWLSSNISY